MSRLSLFLAAFLPFLSLLPQKASTHCQLYPKSDCDNHTAFVPGHNLAGEGVDVTTLQRKGAYLVDTSQWLYPNGSCVLCHNNLMNGQLQRFPLGSADWRVRISCRRVVSSSVEQSDVEVAKAFAGEVKNNWKIKLNLPKEMESIVKGKVVLVGTRSQMFTYAHEKAQQDRYSFVRHEVSCVYYRFRLLSRPKLVSPHFSRAVQNLPNRYDPEEYQHFIDTYGTHYISQVDLGGRVRNLLAVRTCEASLAGLTASDIKGCLNSEASLDLSWFSLSLDNQCHKVHRSQAKRMFQEAYSQRRTEVVGGDSQILFAEPGEVPLYSEWIKKLKASPGIVSYSLVPVHILIDRGDPRREAMKEAVRDYIAQRALWRNCTQQCPGQSYRSSKNPCICTCNPDAFSDSMCCPRERGLARLRVHIQNGVDLDGDPFPFSAADAYVKVFFRGGEMRTRFIKDNNNPWWSETLDFGTVKLTGGDIIAVQVWDKDVWHDDHLATCHESLVAGGTVWKICHPSRGYVVYYYVLECGPALGGTSCYDYVPQKQH